LKLLLQDLVQFYREYILGERVEKDSPALTEGTLTHTLSLEAHLFIEQYAVYPGQRKAGKEYEAFLKTVPEGKIVISKPQLDRAQELVTALKADPVATSLLSGGKAEVSATSTMAGIPVKSRFDYVNVLDGYIVDIKTTSAPTGIESFKEAIAMFQYDLSAALYCAIAADTYGKPFDFYWIVLSKKDKGVLVLKATADQLANGMAKVIRALEIYNECIQTGKWTKGGPMKTNKGNTLQLMKLKGKDYMQVAQRLVWVNDDVPRFNIETEFLKLDDEQTVCKARVILCSEQGEALKMATATKRETKKDFPDHTEKAETGAIGRALALLGFGTQFAVADLDEGDRIVDSPVALAHSIQKAADKVLGTKPAAKKVVNDEFE
jgi:hypothetical protein